MERPRVEFETDDGEDNYREKHQKADLQQWGHRFYYGFQHNLKT